MAQQLTNARIKRLESFLALLMEADDYKRTQHHMSGFYAGTVNGLIVAANLYMNTTERWYAYHRLKEMHRPETAKRIMPL